MAANSLSTKPVSEMEEGSINTGNNRDTIGSPFTPCQLYSSNWKSCMTSQHSRMYNHKCVAHVDNTMKVFSDTLMNKLQTCVFACVSSRRKQAPGSWSIYHNFRALFKLPIVAHCESATTGSKEDVTQKAKTKVLQYKEEEDSLRAEVLNYIAKETVLDRFAVSFDTSYGEFQRLSPQLQIFNQSLIYMFATSLLGGMYVGLRKGRLEFLERNQGTTFFDNSHATRRMQEEMFKNGLKYAFKACFRLVPLAMLTLGVIQSISICRNKSSPLEYSVGIGLAFALANVNRGLKGMISGAVFGSVFGGLAGTGLWLTLKYAGQRQEDIHYNQVEAIIITQRQEKQKPDHDDEPSDVDMA